MFNLGLSQLDWAQVRLGPWIRNLSFLVSRHFNWSLKLNASFLHVNFFGFVLSQAYRRELLEAYECCMKYKRTGKDAELTQVE